MNTILVALIIYLITIIDTLNGLFIGMSIFGIIVFVMSLLINIETMDDLMYTKTLKDGETTRKKLKPWLSRTLIAGIVCCVLAVLTPSRNDALLIVAGTIGYETVTTVLDNGRVQQIGGKSLDALESWLDEQIAESNETKQDE